MRRRLVQSRARQPSGAPASTPTPTPTPTPTTYDFVYVDPGPGAESVGSAEQPPADSSSSVRSPGPGTRSLHALAQSALDLQQHARQPAYGYGHGHELGMAQALQLPPMLPDPYFSLHHHQPALPPLTSIPHYLAGPLGADVGPSQPSRATSLRRDRDRGVAVGAAVPPGLYADSVLNTTVPGTMFVEAPYFQSQPHSAGDSVAAHSETISHDGPRPGRAPAVNSMANSGLRSPETGEGNVSESSTSRTGPGSSIDTGKGKGKPSTSAGIPRRHGCWMCHKFFDRPSTLRKHLIVHTGEKAFQCEHCSRRFSVQSNLKRHVPRCPVVKAASAVANSNSAHSAPPAQAPSSLSSGNQVPRSSRPSSFPVPTSTMDSSASSTVPSTSRPRREPSTSAVPTDPSAHPPLSSTSAPTSSHYRHAPYPSTSPTSPRPKRPRRAPSPYTWLPDSLRPYTFVCTRQCRLPLTPVIPSPPPPPGSSSSSSSSSTQAATSLASTLTSTPTPAGGLALGLDSWEYEERDSYARAHATPYDAEGWSGRLPGPGFAAPLFDTRVVAMPQGALAY